MEHKILVETIKSIGRRKLDESATKKKVLKLKRKNREAETVEINPEIESFAAAR